MQYYRLYFFNGTGISDFEEFTADTDAEAVDHAGRFSGPQMLELWRGRQRIAVVEPLRKQA